jgi:hypothetical protein
MQNDSQRLAQTEQSWLDTVEREKARFDAELHQLTPTDRLATDAQLAGELAVMQRAEAWYASLTMTAQGLASAGYGRLAQRVSFLLNDTRTARGIIQQMIQDRATTMQTIAGIQRTSANEAVATLQDMHKAQQAAFDAMNKQWEDNFKR